MIFRQRRIRQMGRGGAPRQPEGRLSLQAGRKMRELLTILNAIVRDNKPFSFVVHGLPEMA